MFNLNKNWRKTLQQRKKEKRKSPKQVAFTVIFNMRLETIL